MIRKNISRLFGFKDIDYDEDHNFQQGKKVRLNATANVRNEDICMFEDDHTSNLSTNDQISITDSNVSPVQDFFSYYASTAINHNFISSSAKDTITSPSTCTDQSVYSISERRAHISSTGSSHHSDLNYLDQRIDCTEEMLPPPSAVMMELTVSDHNSLPPVLQQQQNHQIHQCIRKNSSWGWFVFTEEHHM